jgi:hypothetical protein
MALTTKQVDLVMDTLYDAVLAMKADNDAQMYDEEIELLQDAIDQIDKWIMDTTDEDD